VRHVCLQLLHKSWRGIGAHASLSPRLAYVWRNWYATPCQQLVCKRPTRMQASVTPTLLQEGAGVWVF
jgi:hypothetical protein